MNIHRAHVSVMRFKAYSSGLVNGDSAHSVTELDSHANMPVFGSECFVFDAVHNKSCNVEPFDSTLGIAKSVPIVDAALAYTCSNTGETWVLLARNVLHISHVNNIKHTKQRLISFPYSPIGTHWRPNRAHWSPLEILGDPVMLCGGEMGDLWRH